MVKQGTQEWHKMRENRIGASDAPPIMGVSPYRTPYQLWQEKLGLIPPRSMNYGMREGLRKEDVARQELEKITGLFFLPDTRIHAQNDWMMASSDAVDPEGKHIAEIKWPSFEEHTLALSGGIPDKYFPQVQHQLEVYELEMAFYFSCHENSFALVEIYRNDKYIKEMLEKEKEFWDKMQSFEAPALIDRDYEAITDENWLMAASEWKELNQKIKELEEKEARLRKEIITLANSRNAIGGGIRLSKVISKGRVDYEKIPELQSVNLDDYRKKPTESFRLTMV